MIPHQPLPSGWVRLRIKRRQTKIGSGKTPSGGSTAYTNEGIPFIRSLNVYDDGFRSSGLVFIDSATDREMKGSRVRNGDVLLNITGASIGRSCIAPDELLPANVNQHVCIIRPTRSLASRYLAYVLKSAPTKQQIDALQLGASREGLNFGQVGDLPLLLPPRPTQRAIADFLDRKTAAIDALIEKKERLIALLAEKRAALIHRAVTKGLAPDVPMKDSGVPWIGGTPAHWEVKRLKNACSRVVVGIAEAATHAYTDSGGVPIVRSTNLRPNYIRTDDLLQVEPWFARRNQSKLVVAGDLLTQRTGEYSGMTAPVPSSLDQCQCFTMVISTPRPGFNPDYLSLFLNSAGETYWDLTRWGSAQPNISVPIVKEAPIPCPPREEQDAIVERLQASAQADPASKVQSQLDKLHEYRQSLITAAVTGQLDIGEDAA